MRSFSMMGSAADEPEEDGGGRGSLPPTVHMPSMVASTGCSLGAVWRIIEAGGGFNGRYRHLLLLYGPGVGEVRRGGSVQLSLPEEDEWGKATGAFHLREPSGTAYKVGEDGTRTEDKYEDMPGADCEPMVVLAAHMPPALGVPGCYSWGAPGSQWTLKAMPDGTVRVTQAAVAGSPFEVRLSPEGNIQYTDQTGAIHSLHQSATSGAAPTRQATVDAAREPASTAAPLLQSDGATPTPAGSGDTVTVSATEWASVLDRLSILEESGQESWEKLLSVQKSVRDTAEMMGEHASDAENKIDSLSSRVDAISNGVVQQATGTSDSATLPDGAAEMKAQELQVQVSGLEKKLLDVTEMMGEQSADAEEKLAGLATTLAASEATVASQIEAAIASLRDAMASSKEELAAKLDTNGDGVVDKDEFTRWAEEQAGRVSQLETRLVADLSALDEKCGALGGYETKLDGLEKKLLDVTEMMGEQSADAEEKLAGLTTQLFEANEVSSQMQEKVQALESAVELRASTAYVTKTILNTSSKAEQRIVGVESQVESLRLQLVEGGDQTVSQIASMDKKIKSIVDMLSEQSVELTSEVEETRKLIIESETRAAAEWKKIAVESKVDSSRVSAVVEAEIARAVRACQTELSNQAMLLEAEVDGRLHATESKLKGLIEKVTVELDPDVKHLQEEYAETKVTMMMVKSEAAEEHHATDTILRVILEIVSVGEMTETRRKAVAALSKIQSDREDAVEKRRVNRVQSTPERLRNSFAGVGGAVGGGMASHSFAGAGSISPHTSPSKSSTRQGLSVSAKTHSIDIQITDNRHRQEGDQVEYAVDVFEIGRDFVTRTW